MERVVVSQMLSYLHSHKLITSQQHGFLSKHSTSTNLLETLQDWTLAIRDKKSVFAVYIDSAKAFDTVSHNKLLHKLSCYGISGNLLNWIRSFLNCRTQQTRVGNCLSCLLYLCSGIVQGSVIGPLLFVLFINDIIDIFSDATITCVCKLFADDPKIYATLYINDDGVNLTDKLKCVEKWCSEWQLSISVK